MPSVLLFKIANIWVINLLLLSLNTYLYVSIILTVGTGEIVDKESSKPHGKTKITAWSTLLQVSC